MYKKLLRSIKSKLLTNKMGNYLELGQRAQISNATCYPMYFDALNTNPLDLLLVIQLF